MDPEPSLTPIMAEPVLPAADTAEGEVPNTVVEVAESQVPEQVPEIPESQVPEIPESQVPESQVPVEEMMTQAAEVPAAQPPPGQVVLDEAQLAMETQVVTAEGTPPSQEVEMPWDEQDLQWDAKCKKCQQPILPQEAVVKAAKVLWCKECNTLYSMVKRHQAWPPPCFQGLTTDQQAAFWAKCKEEKGENGFSYQKIRDLLIRTTTESKMVQRRLDVGGTYYPLSVYKQRGYDIKPGFEERNPRLWSDGLQEYVYMLAETSVHESEVRQTVEAEVACAERMVKKRKKAVEDTKGEKEGEKNEKAASSSSNPVVLDLLTDSEGGQLGGGGMHL